MAQVGGAGSSGGGGGGSAGAGGGGANDKNPEELQPHPVKEQLPDVQYCIKSPPPISSLSSAGLGFLQFCNLNCFRTKFISGFSFFIGISVPQYLREYYELHSKCDLTHASSGWFNDVVIVIFSSHTTVAALVVALFLNRTLSSETEETRKDSGLKWWEKFRLYNADVRNDECYALPCKLNKLFPALCRKTTNQNCSWQIFFHLLSLARHFVVDTVLLVSIPFMIRRIHPRSSTGGRCS